MKRTISFCPQLCAAGGTVVWTNGHFGNDMMTVTGIDGESSGHPWRSRFG